MPNYCDNELSITGTQQNVVDFLNDFTAVDEDNKQLYFSMANIVPEPSTPDDPSYGWYQWRLDNWGCKWDINISQAVEDAYDQIINSEANDKVTTDIYYTTAWGPNLEFLERASKKYPNLTFSIKFYEPGCCIAGHYSYSDGNEDIIFDHDGKDNLSYYIWIVDNEFEDLEYILGEYELEDNLREELMKHYDLDTDDEIEEDSDEDVIDLRNVLLGNNLPNPE